MALSQAKAMWILVRGFAGWVAPQPHLWVRQRTEQLKLGIAITSCHLVSISDVMPWDPN